MEKLDPDIQRFVAQMRDDWSQFPPFDSMSFDEQRASAEQVRARWTDGGPGMATTRDLVFESDAGDLGIRIYLPVESDKPLPALVYLHGGGFTLFSIETHNRLMREYAALGGFAVIGVDYPLAPEFKYPVALDRIESLMLWLGDSGEQWHIDSGRLAMGGDSAGANLSFATCLRLRDRRKLHTIMALLSNYGGFSPEISDESERRFGGPGSIMDRDEARQYWRNYLRDDGDFADPYACPLLADVSGFPPVFLAVPELDIVAEHSLAMCKRLLEAGVATEHKVYPGAVHSFLEAMSISRLAREGISDGALFIRKHIC